MGALVAIAFILHKPLVAIAFILHKP